MVDIVGPICEKCGKPAKILIPILEMRETSRGHKEMVKTYVCLYHLLQLMEQAPDDEPKEPEDEEDEEWDKDFNSKSKHVRKNHKVYIVESHIS